MTPDKVEAALILALCDADGGRSPPHSYERMAKAALSVLTEALAERGTVWRGERARNQGDGGIYAEIKYAKTYADMLILKDQGYVITEIPHDR